MKTYILGMAKSPLQVTKGQYNGIADTFAKPLSPGPSRSLELDFLRLVYATKELRAAKNEVHSYLMVTTPEVVKYAENWLKKYKAERVVNIISADLSQNEIEELVKEKMKNQKANISNAKDKELNARADIGKNIIEDKLKKYIESNHKNEIIAPLVEELPFWIKWDYCGEITGKIKVNNDAK